MNNISKSLLCSLVFVFFATGVSFGAGFKLPEQGAKAMGMSMAWTAQASDPSAIYFNPAGITQLGGQHVLFGGTIFFISGSEFNGSVNDPRAANPLLAPFFPPLPTDEAGKDQVFFGPYAYYTHQVGEKLFLGIGINGPFGLSRTYDPNGNIALRLQHVKLITVDVNPTIAYKINDYFSVGFGINYLHGEAELNRIIPPIPAPPLPSPYPGTNFRLEGDGDAWGWNAGLLITPGYNLRFGFSYRSGYSLDITGDATGLPPLGTTGGSTTIELPDIINIAVAYQTDKFTVEFDWDYTLWSDFENLDITIDNDVIGLGQTFFPQPRNWEDVTALRLGFKYNFSEKCYGSLGLFIDDNPIPEATLSALLPDADRKGFSLGTGFEWKKIGVDIAYMLFDQRDRHVSSPPNSEFDGTWKGGAHLLGFNVSYAF